MTSLFELAPPSMQSLYARLAEAGIDQSYVTSRILPDWWDDEAASTKNGYAHAVRLIASRTGFSLQSLYSLGALTFDTGNIKPLFKLKQGTTDASVEIASNLAISVAKFCANAMPKSTDAEIIPTKVKNSAFERAKSVRAEIQAESGLTIGLDSLLAYCEKVGISVVSVVDFPRNKNGGNRKMDAMAVKITPWPGSSWNEDRYVIMLCCNKQPEAWHLFHLAHELGHICLGHLRDSGFILDESIETTDVDSLEVDANNFAIALLSGRRKVVSLSNKSSFVDKLVISALQKERKYNIDAGFLLLCHAYDKKNTIPDKWGIATRAISRAKPSQNAIAKLQRHSEKWLSLDNLSDDDADFLQSMTGINSTEE